MDAHWQSSKRVIAAGERLIASGQSKDDIHTRIYNLQSKWEQLRKVRPIASSLLIHRLYFEFIIRFA